MAIRDAKDSGINGAMMWVRDAQESAKRIGYSLPPDLVQDLQVAGARTSTYWRIATVVYDLNIVIREHNNNKRTLRNYQVNPKEIRSLAQMGGLDVSQALAKIQNCVKRQIVCQVQVSDITDAGAKMRAATQKMNSVLENLPRDIF